MSDPTIENANTQTKPRTKGQISSLSKKPARRRRPNYGQIHSKPLPLETYPLPAFHPTNPLSLCRLVYAYISELIWPPPSQRIYTGIFSAETHSVHVTDPVAARALWEQGFFGKGSLSRSEPTWLGREKARRRQERIGAEDATNARREARRNFKLERARAEREKIERQRAIEAGEIPTDEIQGTGGEVSLVVIDRPQSHEDAMRVDGAPLIQVDGKPLETVRSEAQNSIDTSRMIEDHKNIDEEQEEDEGEEEIQDQEHHQLTLEEALFLSWGLGILVIHDPSSPTTKPIPPSDSLHLFTRYSTFPPSPPSHCLAPDSRFLLNYATYHHFRSLGWIVRSGIKFGVDYLLYNRGPVFSHAEFAVVILPSYADKFWSTDEGLSRRKVDERRDWWWLHCINRVQSHVLKTLVLCYVDIPPPSDIAEGKVGDVKKFLKRYVVREFVIKRWVPNRSRD